MIEWIVLGLIILSLGVWLIRRFRNRGSEYSAPSGPVVISGSGGSVVDSVKKFKDRCLGAFR